MADATSSSFLNSPAFGALINGAIALWQQKQNSKTPNVYPVAPSPTEQWVTDAKKELYGNASGFMNSYLSGLGNLNPDYKLATDKVGNPSFMGGIKVPSFSFKPGSTTGTPTPPALGGGADNARGGIPKDATGGPPDSTTPGGGPDPFAPGWEGSTGQGGEDSPQFQQLFQAAKQYGPGFLAQFAGGPLASLAIAVFQKLKGSTPSSSTELPGGTPDTQVTLGNQPGNWHPQVPPDLGINKNEGSLGDIFTHPTDAIGAQGTYDFWNGLMNGPDQQAPDYFSMHVNPNVGRKK